MVIDKVEYLWKDFEAKLRSFIYSKIPDKAATEDILQEVFIKIHLKIGTLKDDAKLKPWLYQITRNLIVDYYRRNKSVKLVPRPCPNRMKKKPTIK